MREKQFHFQPRWKEELVVSTSGGSFVLEMPMGVLSVLFPTEMEWERRAPQWARSLWPVLRQELENWCGDKNIRFHIDASADVYPISSARLPL